MRSSWDDAWLDVADAIAKRSACTRAQVGAAVVSASNVLVATGYNGPPAELKTGFKVGGRVVEATCELSCQRAKLPSSEVSPCYDDCIAIHAEANALLFCDRASREGGTVYVTQQICYGCAKLVANSGLRRAVYRVSVATGFRNPERTAQFLRDSGLVVVELREGQWPRDEERWQEHPRGVPLAGDVAGEEEPSSS